MINIKHLEEYENGEKVKDIYLIEHDKTTGVTMSGVRFSSSRYLHLKKEDCEELITKLQGVLTFNE